jgi:hypothetical protein
MKTPVLSLITLCLPLIAEPALGDSGQHGMGMNVSSSFGTPARCGDLDITFDGRPAVRDEQEMAVSAAAGSPLRVQAARNSGVLVQATDRRDVLVTACKAAGSAEELDQIRVTFENGQLTAVGPVDESWAAYLLIEAPRAAALSVEAHNGPISLRGLSGQVAARSENGPISVKDCSGSIDAEAQNGPISVASSGGDVRVRTQNGPISVKLSGSAWDGSGLDARAVNGPVSLKIPAGYRSGTIVESAGRSPFRCRGDACGRARRTWDDDGNRMEFGSGSTVVRLTTTNGPVSVGSADADIED